MAIAANFFAGKFLIMGLVAVSLAGMARADDSVSLSTNAPGVTPPALKKPVLGPPDVAAPRLGHDGQPDQGVMRMHELYLARGKQGLIDVLFLGDSITFNFIGNFGKEVWAKYYGPGQPLKVANFGVGGDCTQHVLWRIDNGELDGIHPKVVVLMIGTNNINAHNTPDDILKGITKIVDEIHAKLPDSKLILLGIFPRAQPYEKTVEAVNQNLAKLDNGQTTRYLDLGPSFKLPDDMTKDWVHINAAGYQVWAETMQPLLDEMLK